MESDLISWLVEQVVGLVLDIMVVCLSALSAEFSEVMAISAKLNGEDTTLNTFFTVFLPNARSGGSTLWAGMVVCGITLLYGIFIFQLFKGLFGPLAKAESPIRLLGRTLLFAILVANARYVCQIFFYLSSAPYEMMVEGTTGSVGLGEGVVNFMAGVSDALIDGLEPGGLVGEIITSLLSIIMLFSILVNYVKLMIEIVERYIILGILSFFSPLCIATGASENTNQIFKSWVKMMLSQCILMCMSVFFITVFEQSVKNVATATAGIDGFIVLLMYLAWLRTGQRIDSHMSTLGLSVAQSGGGLYGDMFAGAALMNAVANPGNTALGKLANNGIGIAQAGGFGAWAASSQGAHALGANASRIARSLNSDKANMNAALHDAKMNQFGRATGQTAMAGAKGKYGDVTDGSGKSLNERFAEGHSMVGATMTQGGCVAEMQDANGNRYTLAWNDKDGGGAAMSADFNGNEDARKSYFGMENEGNQNANDMVNATGGENGAPDSSDMQQVATDIDGNQQNVDGQVDENGNLAAGAQITDEDGNPLGVSDGEGNMVTGAAMVEGSDGEMYDVTGASIDENGNFVDADGNVMTDSNGEALSVGDAGGAMVQGADGQMHDVSGATIDENGNFVDADGNVMTDSQGNALSAEGIQTGTMMTDANGNTTDISSAMDANGNLMTNDAGNLVDAQGNELHDANGNAIAAGSLAQEGAAIAGASGMAALNADGSFKTNAAGNLVDAQGNELKGANGQPISASSMSSQQTLMQGPDGSVSNISAAATGDGGFRTNAAGNLVDAHGNEIKGANGQPIAANSIAAQAAFVSGPNGITNVSAAMGADGKPMTNAAGNLVDSHGNEIKDSKGNAISGSSSIQSGVLAKGADGQLHNVSGASLNANGNFVNSNGQVMTDSNGKAISASGMAVTAAVGAGGATNISSAIGANGQLMTNAAGNLVNASGQELKGANGAPIAASSIAQSGVMMQGAGGATNISSAIGANGQLMTNAAGNLVNSAGQELKGANGAPIAASSLGGVVSTGAMAVGANGQVQNVTGATMSSNGSAMMANGGSASVSGVSVQGNGAGISVNSAGNLVNASGHEITGANGAPIAAAGLSVNSAGNYVSASGQEITGANGAPIAAAGVASFGAQKTIGTDAGGNSYDISGAAFSASGQPMTNSAGNIVNSSGQEIKDSSGNAISGAGMTVSHAAAIGTMAMDDKGQMHDISNSINSTGTGISASAISHDASGSYITANDGTRIAMNGSQVAGGTFAQADGFIQSNPSLQSTPSNVAAGTPTYDSSPTGNLAYGSDGQMHSISNSQTSSGSIASNAVHYDGQGAYINADDGARIAVNGSGAVVGGTYSQAEGTSGAFAITSGSVAVSGGHVETSQTVAAGVQTYNQGGSYALGADGQMHNISSSLTSSGSVAEGAIRSDSNGNFVIASDGARVNIPQNGSVATYSPAQGASGDYFVGRDQSGAPMVRDSNGNIGAFAMTASDKQAVSMSYSESTGGSFIRGEKGGYKEVYNGSEGGGRDANGNIQRYSQDAGGNYHPDAKGSFVKCNDGNGGSSFVNTGTKAGSAIKTYDQNAYYNGIPLTKNSSGGYEVGFNKQASVSFDGYGVGVVNLGNGHSLQLTQKTSDMQPPQGAYMTTTYNGKEYYATPTSQAGAGIQSVGDLYKAGDSRVRDSLRTHYGDSNGNVRTGGTENASFFKHSNGVMTVVTGKTNDKGYAPAISYFPASAMDGKQAFSAALPDVPTVKIGGRDYIAVSSSVNIEGMKNKKGDVVATPQSLLKNVSFNNKQYRNGGISTPQPVQVRSTGGQKTRQQAARGGNNAGRMAKSADDHYNDIINGRK